MKNQDAIPKSEKKKLIEIIEALKRMRPRRFRMRNFVNAYVSGQTCGTKFCAIGQTVYEKKPKYYDRLFDKFNKDGEEEGLKVFLSDCQDYFPAWELYPYKSFFGPNVRDKTPKALARRIKKWMETERKDPRDEI